MRRVFSDSACTVVLFSFLLGGAEKTLAGPLDPLGFTSLGAFPTAAGTYSVSTAGPTPFIDGPTGQVLNGVIYNGIAVFDFNSINLASNQVLVDPYPSSGVVAPPLALLSRGDVSINGSINVSGISFQGGLSGVLSSGGPGGFGGGSGPGAGGSGGYGSDQTGIYFSNGGGGGFGGQGGSGGAGSLTGPPGSVQYSPGGGGPGGGSYGNLAITLQGGSGGGIYNTKVGNGSGGGGGGAIEIGAVGAVTVAGSILADGSAGVVGGGGGSGGGIFLHGDSVALTSSGLLRRKAVMAALTPVVAVAEARCSSSTARAALPATSATSTSRAAE